MLNDYYALRQDPSIEITAHTIKLGIACFSTFSSCFSSSFSSRSYTAFQPFFLSSRFELFLFLLIFFVFLPFLSLLFLFVFLVFLVFIFLSHDNSPFILDYIFLSLSKAYQGVFQLFYSLIKESNHIVYE